MSAEIRLRMEALENKFGLDKEFPLRYFLAELEMWLTDIEKPKKKRRRSFSQYDISGQANPIRTTQS